MTEPAQDGFTPTRGNTPPLALTVAIPTMNGSRHLPETLRAIFQQEGLLFEVLVSDDRSTDATAECARAFAGDRIRVIVNSERLGLAGNWNQCVALCRTPLVAVIHQDDVLRPGHLAAHLRAFEADPAVGLVASASDVIDDLGEAVPATVVERGGLGACDRTFAAGEAFPLLAVGNPLRCSAVSMRTAAHAAVGGFDPSYRYVVDWDFWVRVARRWSLSWLAAPTVDIRWHSASETHRFRTGVTDLEETERVLTGLRGELNAEAQTRARKRLSRAYLNRAHGALRSGDGRLGRDCLRHSLRLWPGIMKTIAVDPRLAAQMAAVWALPGPAGRWFGRPV